MQATNLSSERDVLTNLDAVPFEDSNRPGPKERLRYPEDGVNA
jgi:hypothetical protein